MNSLEDNESWYCSNSSPLVSQMLPLLKASQIKNWKSLFENFSSTDAKIWLPCPTIHGPRTFVMQVTDDSMLNPSLTHSFAIGDYVFVDPDVKETDGRIILVELDNGKLALRQLSTQSSQKRMLKAINPNWPENDIELNDKIKVLGTVIGKTAL